jgi:hypothetical protein
LELADRAEIIQRKLEMYEKAGRAAKAHLPSMGQDSLRSILNRSPLYHENEHIGVAVVKEGLEAEKKYTASYIDAFNHILDMTTEHYNRLYREDKEQAARFLIELMMRNRYSLGLEPNNRPLYDQFEGLEALESQIQVDYSTVKSMQHPGEAAAVFTENLTVLKKR